ncbi:ribbon-helix-helix protein, CopG family [Haloarcula halophila]|uniref:ribbon-helix-helix protein, CopG family n=1 Tax=Haloarcula TaxID=2237 RepID=UPI0023E3A49A|nr:ribbon-helix-helix protein, CopG family [Halomicroarcula sp. DFY41]
MTRDNRIQVYPSDELAEKIERRAEEAGLSISEFCSQALETHLEQETRESEESRYNPSKRLEVKIEQARQEVMETLDELESETSEEIEQLQALRTMYVISLWELLKEDYGPAQRKEAMERASERLADRHSTDEQSGSAIDAE